MLRQLSEWFLEGVAMLVFIITVLCMTTFSYIIVWY